MDILVADISDIDELARVEIESKTESIPECLEAHDVDLAHRTQRLESYLDGTSFPQKAKAERVAFKAVVDGHVVGFLAGHLTARHGKDSEIESFYVLKGYQRAGVGRRLLSRFLNWVDLYHVKSLCVGFDPRNPYRAFYLKHGGSYLNPHWIAWDDLDELRRRLAEQGAAE